MSAHQEPSTPPPTQQAYKPATREDLRNGMLLGVLCLFVFAVGVALWVFGIDAVVGSGNWRTGADAFIIAIGAPLMLLAAAYFFYTTWRDWQRSAHFHRHKQRTRGAITHLWRGKDASGRKAYFVGYQYADGQNAYQSVPKRRYDSLELGDQVNVEYLPDDPKLSYFEPIRKRSSRKKADTAAG